MGKTRIGGCCNRRSTRCARPCLTRQFFWCWATCWHTAFPTMYPRHHTRRRSPALSRICAEDDSVSRFATAPALARHANPAHSRQRRRRLRRLHHRGRRRLPQRYRNHHSASSRRPTSKRLPIGRRSAATAVLPAAIPGVRIVSLNSVFFSEKYEPQSFQQFLRGSADHRAESSMLPGWSRR